MDNSSHYCELSCKNTVYANYRYCEIHVLHSTCNCSTQFIIEMRTWLCEHSAKQYLKVHCSGVVFLGFFGGFFQCLLILNQSQNLGLHLQRSFYDWLKFSRRSSDVILHNYNVKGTANFKRRNVCAVDFSIVFYRNIF